MKTQAKQLDVYERAKSWQANRHLPPSDYGFIDEERVNFELLTYNRQAHNNMRYLTLPRVCEGAYLCLDAPVSVLSVRVAPKGLPGRYKIKVHSGVIDEEGERYLELGLGARREFKVLQSGKVEGTLKKPKTVEFEVDYQKGDPQALFLRLRMPKQFQNIRRIYFNSVAKTGLGPKPNIWVDWVEVEGPFYDQWPPKNVKQLFPPVEGKRDLAYAKKVIKSFAWRAFRGKKVDDAYVDALSNIYEERVSEGMDFIRLYQNPWL